jgi:hypothetical protein
MVAHRHHGPRWLNRELNYSPVLAGALGPSIVVTEGPEGARRADKFRDYAGSRPQARPAGDSAR